MRESLRYSEGTLCIKALHKTSEEYLSPKERRDMNLNDFVVLPNNKAKSVKLNARNLQELQMETVTLALESKEMEEKLQQLKESMSKEKEERGHSGGFRWKSGQCGPLNSNALTNNTKKRVENRLQKLSAGKVKIRVLKDEPLTAHPQPPPPPPAPTGPRTTRKSRLRGTICGQCEVKAAGLICAECSENYCISCFSSFHQKGALKLHRMIPIQTRLQTHVLAVNHGEEKSISVGHGDSRPDLLQREAEGLEQVEGMGGGYISGWSSRKTVLPTWLIELLKKHRRTSEGLVLQVPLQPFICCSFWAEEPTEEQARGEESRSVALGPPLPELECSSPQL
ncbi:zinc finger B-box domain-containing protein 1 isoform X3 [Lates japonicus]|uniref:Zinc finger B-box domain-containing protein 1 isoform X3 n=1 Tax=Lates japonicus TaxID=270547 RepID=A0AAD3NF62_LATJO|nr:zinc finger B-box domain-containing protein 1 isoform X3 [Lates japonicus]